MDLLGAVIFLFTIILCYNFKIYETLDTSEIDKNGVVFNNYSYFFVYTTDKHILTGTYSEAEQSCLDQKASLVDITSELEQRLVNDLVLNNSASSQGVWIKTKASSFENWGPFQKVSSDQMNGTCILSVVNSERTDSVFLWYGGYSAMSYDQAVSYLSVNQSTPGFIKVNTTNNQDSCAGICQNETDCVIFTVILIPEALQSTGGYLCIRSTSLETTSELFIEPNATIGLKKTDGVALGSWFVSDCSSKHPYICESPVVDYSIYDCPDGYFQLRKTEKCYKIHSKVKEPDGVTWHEARQICQAGPGRKPDLASFHNIIDIAVVASQFHKYMWEMWIGYSYSSTTYDWVWVDGSSNNFTNWAEIPPAYSSYRCGEMITSPGVPGTWSSISCYLKRGYICETYKVQTNNVEVNDTNSSIEHCKDGWLYYNDACYLLKQAADSWEEAEELCAVAAQTANLVSVHSEAENAFLLGMFSLHLPLWLGLSQNPESEFLWSNGWPVTFTKWSNNGIEHLGKCSFMSANGSWILSPCLQQKKFVCKYSLLEKPAVPIDIDGVCPGDQWLKWGGHCYFFWIPSKGESASNKDSEYKFSWPEGQSICKAIAPTIFNSSLVSIESHAENTMIANQVERIMQKFDGHTTVWIGLHRNGTAADFQFVDHSPLAYDPWAPGEPNSPELATQCVEMKLDVFTGSWNDHPCSEKTYFICKSNIVSETLLEEHGKISSEESKCPTSAWKEYKGNCYFIRPFGMLNWERAIQECKNLSRNKEATLITVHDLEENHFIQTELIRQRGRISSVSVWIGLHKTGPHKQNPYKWVDGSVLVFQNWADDEPNDRQGVENCVELTAPSGEWNDNNCNEQKGYVCKVWIKGEEKGQVTEEDSSMSASRKFAVLAGTMVMAGFIVIALIVMVVVFLVRKKGRKNGGDYVKVLFQNNPGGE